MTKCFDEKVPWKKKKKKCFLAESSKNRNKKKKMLKKWLSVFFVFPVLASNVRGKKILFSFHILSLWSETYPKMYSTPLYLLGEGHNPPPEC